MTRLPSSNFSLSSPSSASSQASPSVPQALFAVMVPPPPPKPKSPPSKLHATATSPTIILIPPQQTPCPIRAQVPMLTQPLPASMQQVEELFSTLSSAPTSTIFPHPPKGTSSQNQLWQAAPPTRTHTSSTPGDMPTDTTPTVQTHHLSGQQPELQKAKQISG